MRNLSRKHSRPAFHSFFREFQPLLQVIGRGSQLHALVGLRKAQGVDLAHGQVLGKGAKNGFHRGLAFGLQVPAARASHPGVVALILGPEMRHGDALLLGLAQTVGPERAAFADMLAGPVFPLFGFGTMVQEYFFERDGLALGAAILILVFLIGKTLRPARIGAMGRNITGDAFLF